MGTKSKQGKEVSGECSSSSTLVFNFAIGSIFNDESRRTSSLKNKLQAGDGTCKQAYRSLLESEVSGYELVRITKGYRRMWTYPSNRPWNIFAVSLHKDDNHQEEVLGGLVMSSRETFVMMGPREAEYK